jgi:DNA polymerase II large subunit
MVMFSDRIEKYAQGIKSYIEKVNKIATEARKKGFDPEDTTEMPIVENMAERVEGLISVIAPQIGNSGVSERIKELEDEFGSLDWRVALSIGLEIAKEKYCKFKDKKESMEIGIRTGFAYLTMGIVASPLEGFVELKIRKRKDNGNEYFAVSYAGPIRSAGGTGASVSLILIDYIRKNMGYDLYDPTEEEQKRFVTELYDYHDRIANLQYLPSEEEIAFLAKNIPVQIDGDGAAGIEVSNYKDLPRVETNGIRNGVCLVIGEGIAQKSEKVWKQLNKWGHDFGLEHWDFMKEFVDLKKKMHAKGAVKKKSDNKDDGKEKPNILPDTTFIKDLVGGRPIFTHPMREGGFRLRYGRGRTSGYSSYCIHPSTMYILENYLAIGTQLKNERPGKGCTVSVNDSIEGPIVRLIDGTVMYLGDPIDAKKVAKDVEEIIFMGDILMNYGDFLNRAHKLVPPGYCEEWWIQELEKAVKKIHGEDAFTPENISLHTKLPKDIIKSIMKNPLKVFPSFEEAIIISKTFNIPLHPKLTYHFKNLTKEQINNIVSGISSAEVKKDDYGKIRKLVIPSSEDIKKSFERAGIPHLFVNKEFIVIEKDTAKILYRIFNDVDLLKNEETYTYLKKVSGIKLRDKSGIFIGARMGRPEKGKMRKLQGSPHVLFPIGEEGGRLRSFQATLDSGKVTSDFPLMFCTSCKKETPFRKCESCGKKTIQLYSCRKCGVSEKEKCEHGDKLTYTKKELDIKSVFKDCLKIINIKNNVYPDLIKGVRGTSNESHIPEHLTKGILRAKYGVYVNKDGTVRYDMTQLPLTHFKPIEIGTSIEKLKELGYSHDVYGEPLTRVDQILEILPQDIVLPRCVDCPDDGAHIALERVCNFIDDLLVNLYGLKPFYNIKKEEDIAGHIVLCLAPHTSAGIAARIIGFSDTQGFLAHPLIHAATRRDCDGDEACVTMLMDAFLNFSKHYLPAHRGSKQDAPLVITWLLTPGEVDDMVFDLDIVDNYPLEFYEACLDYKNPWDIKLETVNDNLGKPKQYEGMMFTHDTTNFNHGVLCSAYKTLPSMSEKLDGQMSIAKKIRAVDASDVARLTIEKHFMKDTKGNLRKFSMQKFRCVSCNEKYRRPPLTGKCTKCGGKIIFTISEGSIIKYLQPSIDLANNYNVPEYLKQSLEIIKRRVEAVFGKETEKQEGLDKWF